MSQLTSGMWEVVTEKGIIVAEHVVNAAGHYSKTYGVDGIDWDLSFHLTDPDVETLVTWLEQAARRIPAFGEAGIKTVISGPITHTPDSGYLIGPAPGVRNYWHCNGASIGITRVRSQCLPSRRQSMSFTRCMWCVFRDSTEQHSFRRSNAFEAVGDECRGVRERVGVAELTAFAKYEVTGPDSALLLDRLSANRIPGRVGGIRLVHMLTELGGIECEMTITRFGSDRFYLNSSIMGKSHDLDWLVQHIGAGERVEVADLTDSLGLLAVTGPRSRE